MIPYLGISKVRYDSHHALLDYAVQHLIDDNGLHEGRQVNRKDILSNLYSRMMYKTIVLAANNMWSDGADIGIVTIHGIDYLKTDRNPIPCDKLGNLPEF